jgi:ectoine hydroxylase-related dioxygenase (phytanoyl-CoA dioxygenase family)
MDAGLGPQQIASYRRDGYVRVEGVFDASSVAALNDAADEFEALAAERTASDEVLDLGPGHRPGHVDLRRVRDPERHHPAFRDAHVDPVLMQYVADLLGPDVRAHSSKLNIKQPGSVTAVEWHQDWAFGASTNDDILTVGIALGTMDRESGCLEVIPGSHAGPILDHELDGRFVGMVTEPGFQPRGAVPVELGAGDVSMHHTRLLHGSAPNRSDRSRRLLLLTFAAADSWPLAGVSDRVAFDGMIVRGAAPRAPRLAAVPVRPAPHWDELDGSSLFELQQDSGRGVYRS